MKNVVKVSLALFALVMVVGCASGTASRTAGINVNVDPATQKRTVEIGDSSLASKIEIETFSVRDGDHLRSQAQVKNLTQETIRCEYKVVFYNETGMMIDDPLNRWQAFAVNGMETVALSALAPAGPVSKYTVMVRKDKGIRD
jgi:uncharacterized protein YcfL